MKWKQMLVVVGILGASGSLLAQDAKTLSTNKPVKKQAVVVVNNHPGKTGKVNIRKSLNPDRPDFVGVPMVIEGSK